jgi:hypothetical protein
MAARQKATRHELEDGFVAAWDSSEIDEDLRRKLIDLADRPLVDIIVGMGGDAEKIIQLKPAPASSERKRASARRAAA